jgi:2-polyprenyl-3-methyl-5-hydroxy-6-metoxy-1,4-benzoquinol methylase
MVEKKIFGKDYFEKSPYGRQNNLIIWRNYKILLDDAKTAMSLLNKPQLILDFGCASGVGTAFLARCFPKAKVVGVDISDYAIKKAKSNYKRESIDYYCLDLSHSNHISFLQEKYGEFDLIFTRDTLEHVEFDKQEKIVSAFTKLLERDGVVIAQTPNKLSPFSRSDRTHIGLRSPNSWRMLFEMFFGKVIILVEQYVPLLWRFRKNKELLEFPLPIFGYNINIFCEMKKK